MAPPPSHHDKEIDAILNRLHSGCRFVDFQDHSNNNGSTKSNGKTSKGRNGHDDGSSHKHRRAVSNALRNVSPPDESHGELGRALAYSYVGSLIDIEESALPSSSQLSLLPPTIEVKNNENNVQSAIARGSRIIQSLCCGEDSTANNNNNNNMNSNDGNGKEYSGISPNKVNYASVANAFFNHLQSFCLKSGWKINNNNNDGTTKDGTDAVFVFLKSQWQLWCIQCEEFFDINAAPSNSSHTGSTRGGGIHVLQACLKGYASICFLGHGSNHNSFASSNNINTKHGDYYFNSDKKSIKRCKVYESLRHSFSRKIWIRTSVARSLEFVRHGGIYSDFFKENNANASSESSEQSLCRSLVDDLLSPLFQSCVLRGSQKGQPQNHHNNIGRYHSERQLLLREILCGISRLLHNDVTIINTSGNNTSNAKKSIAIIIQSANMVQYMSASLSSYICQSISASCSSVSANTSNEEESEIVEILELSYEWLRGTCDLIQMVLTAFPPSFHSSLQQDNSGSRSVVTDALSKSVEIIIATILPQLASSITTTSFPLTFDMASLYACLGSYVTILPRCNVVTMANPIVAIRLGTLALNLQDDVEVKLVSEIMLGIFGCLDKTGEDEKESPRKNCGVNHSIPPFSNSSWVGGILCSLGCIFSPRLTCADTSVRLKRLGGLILQSVQVMEEKEEEKKYDYADSGNGCHLMDIFACALDHDGNLQFQALIGIISSSISNEEDQPSIPMNTWERRPLSLTDQLGLLLLGLSLLHISVALPSTTSILLPCDAFKFLRSFLQFYPRMASRAVPSIIDVVRMGCILQQNLSQTSMNQTLIESLQFLASPSIVSDPHGAHIAWKFLSSLTEEGMPTVVRAAVIRIFADMCSSNKKLCRRITNVIGKSMTSRDPIIRIAATATLSDLARYDLLRDVEDIIGWIQNRLKDEEPAVVYYALVTLRYLVKNEELEFDLVIRVLEKRLDIDLGDVHAVLGRESMSLEGLILLLGEGSLNEDEESEESDEDENAGPQISPQLTKAVSFLVDCHEVLLRKDSDVFSNALIRRRIYHSLANYSAQVLGLDPESIRSWDGVVKGSEESIPDIDRYLKLKAIALTGLDFVAQLSAKPDNGTGDDGEELVSDTFESVSTIAKTLLLFEEEVHGSFLFRSGGSSNHGASDGSAKKKNEGRARVPKAILSSLPDAADIQHIFEDDPRSASAAAVLCTIGSASDTTTQPTNDVLMQISECFYDLVNEPLVDPPFQAIQTWSLLHCMERVWSSIEDADESTRQDLFNQVVSQIEEWTANCGEYAYVAMAAFALIVDESAQFWSGVTKIQNTILEGRSNYLFETEDTKALCVSMVAAKLSQTADARVSELIDFIEGLLEVSYQGNQSCFGALFGMGIIVKNLVNGSKLNGSDPSEKWRRHLVQRVTSIFITVLNTCLVQSDTTVLNLASSIKSGQAMRGLSKACTKLDELHILDSSHQKMKALLIGLAQTFPVLSATSPDLLKCVLDIVNKLPWGSGKGFALHAAYKSCMDAGLLDQKHLSEVILNTFEYAQDDHGGFDRADSLFSLASLCPLSTGNVQKELDFISETVQKSLKDVNMGMGRDGKSTAILAGCVCIGDIPGLSLTPQIHFSVKKDLVSFVVQLLKETALDDVEELKCRDASTIGLGILCAMKSTSHKVKNTRKGTTGKASQDRLHVDLTSLIQAKDGTVLQAIFHEVERAHLLRTSSHQDGEDSAGATRKLPILFSTLECLAMPGSFSRIIEVTLNNSPTSEVELKTSSIGLLVSQLENRRRVGFDGRGFVDLSARLAKMTYHELINLVGYDTLPIIMKALPDLVYQLPTSVGEDVTNNLWTICQTTSNEPSSTLIAQEFLDGVKTILVSAEKQGASSKRLISPALLRAIHKIVVGEIFVGLCKNASPYVQSTGPCAVDKAFHTETIWTAYLQCVEMVPSSIVAESDGPTSEINRENVFGMASCARIFSSKSTSSASYRTRKIESWIALQEWPDFIDGTFMAEIHVAMISALVIAPQCSNEIEMKESVLSLFEIMLVKGVNTMCLDLLAIKVAFWWESHQMRRLQFVDIPTHRVSKLSSLFVARNLCFSFHSLSPNLLTHFFDSCIADLPSKLALLCGMWKISDDVSNRASRIFNDGVQSRMDTHDLYSSRQMRRSLDCLRDIVRYINGEEM